MMKKTFLIFTITTLLFATVAIQPDNTPQEKLKTLVYDACSEDERDVQLAKLISVQARLKDKTNWERSAENIIYMACFQEYPSWLTGLAFNLGIIGLNEGLEEETIEEMTRLLGHRTFGKPDYIQLGRLYEKLHKTGIDQEYVHELILTPFAGGYTPEAVEAVSILYLQHYKKSREHKEALAYALESAEPVKNARSLPEALDMVFPAEVAEGEKSPSITSREPELTEKQDKYWAKVERSIRDKPVFKVENHKWNVVKLRKFVDTWEGVPYLYGGMSRRGIDCSGLVIEAAKDQFPEVQLPRTAMAMSSIGRKVSPQSLQPGDLLFFSGSKNSKKITHVGIYIEEHTFVHASSKRGVTRSKLDSNYYQNRLIKAQRIF